MTLTATEKSNVMFYLGWPLKTLDESSTLYHRTMAARLDNLSDPTEIIVRKLLGDLAKIEKEIDEARPRLKVKKFDKIELNEGEIAALLKEKARARKDLSQAVDIPTTGGSNNMVNITV